MIAVLPTFAAGLLTAGFLVAALFFLKFWQRSKDRLFASFAFAFLLMAANSAAPVLMNIPDVDQPMVFLLRLAAFLLIIIAVLRKNVGKG